MHMKKLVAFALGLFMVAVVLAQEGQDEGNRNKAERPGMWLGGQVAFGSMSSLDFTFGPNFGLMIGEHAGVGATLLFSSGDNAFEWGLEPYFRYYLPVIDQFSFYGEAFFGVGGGDNATNLDGGDYNTLDFGARAGLQFWVVPRWSLAASSNIFMYNSTNNNGEFGAGLNLNTVRFSLFFHF